MSRAERGAVKEQEAEIRKAYDELGNVSAVARKLELPPGSVWSVLNRAFPSPVVTTDCKKKDPKVLTANDALILLRKKPLTLDELSGLMGISKGNVLDWVDGLPATGVNIHKFGDKYSIEKNTPLGHSGVLEYVSRPDNTYIFGACGDFHLGSRYERLGCAEALFDRYADEEVDRVFDAGNWIDGEARFNKFDIHTHGMGPQLDYLAAHYPRRDGIETFAVSGDDHEGWYGQREGVNIGAYAEHHMRDAGRNDWHHVGFMEATFKLVNANTGKDSPLLLMHPGGGSAYATSYALQKIVESLEGGTKPSVLLAGHYHKLWSGNIRNVWVAQTGTCQDQTPFMRKKRLEAHVGGFLIKLKQDPETGAITEMTPTMIRFFNKEYYTNGRWSHSSAVTLPARSQ